MLTEEEFGRLATEALEELPASFRQRLDNVEIVIEEWPDQQTLRLAGCRRAAELLGFYHGIPLSRRGSGYHLVSPDRISLYRQPILLRCRSRRGVRQLVRRVLRHEIAHHFGLSDERLEELGAY